MVRLVEWAIANSIVVAILAPLFYCISRVCRRPAIRHGLWVLLLVKLVTPPLWSVTLPEFARTELSATIQFASPPTPPRIDPAQPPVKSWTSIVPSAAPASVPVELVTPAVSNLPAAIATPPSSSPDSDPATTLPVGIHWASTARVALLIWAIGSILVFTVQSWRVLWFSRRLRRASWSSAELTREAERAVAGLSIRRLPPVFMINGVVSPMLWGLGRQTRILFPQQLFHQLDSEARSTLILHELAHYSRGDHWVRLLEFAAQTLFWWHPAVWFSFREIEASEEDCCDNWVMERTRSSPRCYAEALLDTVDFLCENLASVPPITTGLGNSREIRGRLVRIMQGGGAASGGLTGKAILTFMLLALPMQPQALAALNGSLASVLDLNDPADLELTSKDDTDSSQNQIASAVRSGTIESPRSVSANITPKLRSPILATASSQDRRFELLLKKGGRVELFDLDRDSTRNLSDWTIKTAAFLPGEPRFVTGGVDRQVRLWDAQTGKVVQNFAEHKSAILAVAAGIGQVAAGSADGELALYDPANGELIAVWQIGGPVTSIRFSDDQQRLIVGAGEWRTGKDARLQVINLIDHQVEHDLPLDRPSGVVAFADRSNVAVVGSWDGRATWIDLNTGSQLATLQLEKDQISALAFSQDAGVFPPVSTNDAIAQQPAPVTVAEPFIALPEFSRLFTPTKAQAR
jgi:bla regulator protein BlaR1